MRMTASPVELADEVRPTGYDRLGLALAVAFHVGLAVALEAWDRTMPPPPIPERISVTVSEEVALESVSPNPMADPAPSVAQEIGDPVPPAPQEPAATVTPREVAEPRPALVPAPSKKPVPAKSTPKPTQAKPSPAKPAPAKAAPSRGSRLGNDFLAGTGGSGRDADQPAARAGPLTAASLAGAISRQLRPHWTAPQGVDADKLVTILSWQMNPDGSLRGRPEVVSQLGVNDANAAQKDRHAELAIRAVQLAAPFDLPREFYDQWKNVSSFRFDRKL